MKTLSLIRHAKSSWSDPGLNDRDRPLNKRGKRDAPRMAAYYAQQYQPDLLVSSPARRALTTALEFSKALGFANKDILVNEAVYAASTKELSDVLAQVPDSVSHVALFGHNPEFTDLCNELTGAGFDNIPTTGVAVVGIAIESWRELIDADQSKLDARLENFFYPKMFK